VQEEEILKNNKLFDKLENYITKTSIKQSYKTNIVILNFRWNSIV